MAHPSDRIRGASSGDLAGKRIVLGVAGSIAAVKTVELARELIRHGADVVPVMTPAATRILHPDALEFATGRRAITTLTGQVEHVRELGEAGDADLLLVAPATANTVAKIALGIDDTTLTTFATVALGANRPIVVAPAMHGVMEDNPAVQTHEARLRELGVRFVRPKHEEGKAKLADVDDIVATCARALGPRSLEGRRVLVVTGGSSEPIDPVRVITNRSSGRTGLALAQEAHRLGATLTVLTPDNPHHWPPDTDEHHFTDVRMLIDTFHTHLATLAPDIVLVPAALGDFAPRPAPAKISSDRDRHDITLDRLPKALPVIRQILPHATIIGWKLQDTLEEAVEAARARLDAYGIDGIVANASASLGSDEAEATFVTPDGDTPLKGTKRDIARQLFAAILTKGTHS